MRAGFSEPGAVRNGKWSVRQPRGGEGGGTGCLGQVPGGGFRESGPPVEVEEEAREGAVEFERYESNPLLTVRYLPVPALGVYNPGVAEVDGEVVLLLRVEGTDGRSRLHVARSPDGGGGWRVDPTPLLVSGGRTELRRRAGLRGSARDVRGGAGGVGHRVRGGGPQRPRGRSGGHPGLPLGPAPGNGPCASQQGRSALSQADPEPLLDAAPPLLRRGRAHLDRGVPGPGVLGKAAARAAGAGWHLVGRSTRGRGGRYPSKRKRAGL